ncbi:MAG TPA: hypothetical protein PKO23_16515 [Candidatus Hydrogenedentes bacterium]|nr:hypothetical protein [Candidatus Hydrogenedentota bacterium]
MVCMRSFMLCLMFTGLCFADNTTVPDALWRALLDAPPAREMTAARKEALRALDAWIAQPNSEDTEACAAYYRRAVDRVLTMLETEPPEQGVRVFQLYSSSVLVQTPSAVIGIDLDQGPNESLHQSPAEEGVAFCMTPEQIERLAALVDYGFHTHEHADHLDYQITRALLEKGKTVIGTEGIRAIWADEPWAEAIVTPPQTLGRGEKIGDLEVNVLRDRQWNNESHDSGTENNAYLITLPEGLSIFVKGDINCGLRLYGWLQLLAEKGCAMDVMLGSLIYWRGPGIAAQIDALYAPLLLPGHTWEFGHRRNGEARGNAMGFLQSALLVKGAAKRGGATVLSWGEFIDLPLSRGPIGNRP